MPNFVSRFTAEADFDQALAEVGKGLDDLSSRAARANDRMTKIFERGDPERALKNQLDRELKIVDKWATDYPELAKKAELARKKLISDTEQQIGEIRKRGTKAVEEQAVATAGLTDRFKSLREPVAGVAALTNGMSNAFGAAASKATSLATGLVSSFATGGVVGAAIGAAAAGVSVLVERFNASADAAEKASERTRKALEETRKKQDELNEKIREELRLKGLKDAGYDPATADLQKTSFGYQAELETAKGRLSTAQRELVYRQQAPSVFGEDRINEQQKEVDRLQFEVYRLQGLINTLNEKLLGSGVASPVGAPKGSGTAPTGTRASPVAVQVVGGLAPGDNGSPYGRRYTQDDVDELIATHDLPGHGYYGQEGGIGRTVGGGLVGQTANFGGVVEQSANDNREQIEKAGTMMGEWMGSSLVQALNTKMDEGARARALVKGGMHLVGSILQAIPGVGQVLGTGINFMADLFRDGGSTGLPHARFGAGWDTADGSLAVVHPREYTLSAPAVEAAGGLAAVDRFNAAARGGRVPSSGASVTTVNVQALDPLAVLDVLRDVVAPALGRHFADGNAGMLAARMRPALAVPRAY